MSDILKVKKFIQKAFTPVTIMFVPHSKNRPLNFRLPFVGIVTTLLLSCIGIGFILSVAIDTFEYYRMKQNLNYYTEQFLELRNTISALKRAEAQFSKLFSHESKEEVLMNLDTSDSGSIDIENLKLNIKNAVETVGEIRDYLRVQRDIFVATPRGLPVNGRISSHFGMRTDPIRGGKNFHSGLDISANPGDEVRATADGVVSFSGWNGGSGNLVVLEHGHGFSTFYAHNKMNVVKVGQKVKGGEVIAYIGSTGSSTGPHVHYEIWKDGKPVNPADYREGRS